MAETSPIIETLVNDLLSRVQKLETSQQGHEHTNIQEYLGTLDRVAFSMTIAIDIVTKILIDKGLTTKEDLQKMLNDERERISKTITEQASETKKEEAKA